MSYHECSKLTSPTAYMTGSRAARPIAQRIMRYTDRNIHWSHHTLHLHLAALQAPHSAACEPARRIGGLCYGTPHTRIGATTV
jgi:hypothetical protein